MSQQHQITVEATNARWSSRYAFVLAATGSAVGLGNIWKFPYITGENGGGAFVLVYLLCIMLIGVPVMISEVLLGRRARRSPINAYAKVAQDENRSGLWKYAGGMGMLAGFLVVSFYTVIAGWALAYVFEALSGNLNQNDATAIAETFSALTDSAGRVVFWGAAMLLTSMVVVGLGVNRGLERSLTWLMPLMFLILIALLFYAAASGGFMQGLNFMFRLDFSQLTANGVVIALGHAFFTLSLGAGIMLMYGAYLPKTVSIPKAVGLVAVADTLVALIAGMAIFPVVFANGLSPQGGPGLIFQVLPLAFSSMPAGQWVGLGFFVMLTVAAFASIISLIEGLTVFAIERRGWSRARSVSIVGVAIFLMSLGTAFSFNIGSDWQLAGLNFFGIVDYLSTNIMLPASGLLVAVFTGWKMSRSSLSEELGWSQQNLWFRAWLLVSRVLAPVLILLVFANGVGLIQLSS